MENWGLITYRLTSILYDEKESSSANKQWVAVVIAHELAHQVRDPPFFLQPILRHFFKQFQAKQESSLGLLSVSKSLK